MPNFVEQVSEFCRRTGQQNCHICEDADCGDNENPSITRLRAELAKVQKVRDELIQIIEEHGHNSPDAPRLASDVMVKSLKQDLKIAKEMQRRAEKQAREIADQCQKSGSELEQLKRVVMEAIITIGGKTIPLKEMVDAVKVAGAIGSEDE